jgi:hypothetical protein
MKYFSFKELVKLNTPQYIEITSCLQKFLHKIEMDGIIEYP